MPVSLSANEIDRIVGQRMRQRRESLGISQGRLGRHLGLTFSQIQKYEKGANRIGAGRLLQITAYLGKLQVVFNDTKAELSRLYRTNFQLSEELRTISDNLTREINRRTSEAIAEAGTTRLP